ncbi:MAG: hypothetical protein JW893_09030 [Candidatus Omnitrophica bacterium]|nr:hypothetical protein [Candidatus Omnitrophota bacterium]
MNNWLQPHLNAAIMYFFLNDLKNAWHHADEAKSYGKDIGAAWISGAFLKLYEENYDAAIAEYQEALKRKIDQRLLVDVTWFISHYFDANPTRIQFQFAIGLLTHYSGNAAVSRAEFERFVAASQVKTEYDRLRDEAAKFLGGNPWPVPFAISKVEA